MRRGQHREADDDDDDDDDSSFDHSNPASGTTSSLSFRTSSQQTAAMSAEASPMRHGDAPLAGSAPSGQTTDSSKRGPVNYEHSPLLSVVPVEVLRYALRFLDPVTLIAIVSRTCVGLRRLLRSPSLWVTAWSEYVRCSRNQFLRRRNKMMTCRQTCLDDDMTMMWHAHHAPLRLVRGDVFAVHRDLDDEMDDDAGDVNLPSWDLAQRALFALCHRPTLSTSVFTHNIFVADGFQYRKETQGPQIIFGEFAQALKGELSICLYGEAIARESAEYLRTVAMGSVPGRRGVGVFFPVLVCAEQMETELADFWQSQCPPFRSSGLAADHQELFLLPDREGEGEQDQQHHRAMRCLYRERELLEYHFLLSNVSFTDIKQYVFPEEVKVAVCSSILSQSGRSAELRFFVSMLQGSYPRLYFKCIYIEGNLPGSHMNAEFERNPSLSQVLFHGGFGRVEVDIAPVVFADGIRHLASILEVSSMLPWRLLWNVVMYASGGSHILSKHTPALLLYYQSSLVQACERALNLQPQL